MESRTVFCRNKQQVINCLYSSGRVAECRRVQNSVSSRVATAEAQTSTSFCRSLLSLSHSDRTTQLSSHLKQHSEWPPYRKWSLRTERWEKGDKHTNSGHSQGSLPMNCGPGLCWDGGGFGVPTSLFLAILVLALANSSLRVWGISGSNRTPWDRGERKQFCFSISLGVKNPWYAFHQCSVAASIWAHVGVDFTMHEHIRFTTYLFKQENMRFSAASRVWNVVYIRWWH